MKNMRTLSHYGHEGVELFVTYGYGLWPYAVFANQIALLGPASDPARVREGGLAGQGRLARASPHAGSAGRARSVGGRRVLLWGGPPFMRLKPQAQLKLEPRTESARVVAGRQNRARE